MTLSSDWRGSLRSRQSSAAGLSLLAQPAARTPFVSRTAVVAIFPPNFYFNAHSKPSSSLCGSGIPTFLQRHEGLEVRPQRGGGIKGAHI